ncbi:unnamed protein product [Calypogeia fissa]
MASWSAQSSLLAPAGLLPRSNKEHRTINASRRHPLRLVVASARDPTANCATAREESVDAPSSSFSSSSPYLDGGSDGASSISRREAVLAGVTALAGLGGIDLLFSSTVRATEAKQTNLSIEDVKKVIEADIIERQYPVTGNLTESIYNENCRFQDPTIDIQGVKKYTAALQFLFEPDTSKHEILNIEVTGPRTVQVDWRLRGYMKLPWRPYIPPYEGTTTYTTDESGLIVSHSETWKISPFTAFIQALTPSFLSKDAPV